MLSSKRFTVNIRSDGKLKGLGTYDTVKQAAMVYDAAAIELSKPLSKLNFPKKVPPGYTPVNNGQRSTNTTGFRGVTNQKNGYQAQIVIKGKDTYLGLFDTLKHAAIAYDHAVHKHRLPSSRLNFPTMKHNLNKEPTAGRKKQKVSSSGFRGVQETKSGKYKAKLYVTGKQIYLGLFDTAEKAAAAFNHAVLKHAIQGVNAAVEKVHLHQKLLLSLNRR